MKKTAKGIALIASLLSGVVLSAVCFLWFAAGEIYDYKDSFSIESQDAKEIDVVLCLAGGRNRIPLAIHLWQELKSIKKDPPLLFLSGVGLNTSQESLVEQGVSAQTLAELKPEWVIFEQVSQNTEENAQIFASFARQKRWKRVLLVTSSYHMRRSEFWLKKVLEPDVKIFTRSVEAPHFQRDSWHRDSYAIRVTLIEYLKWLSVR